MEDNIKWQLEVLGMLHKTALGNRQPYNKQSWVQSAINNICKFPDLNVNVEYVAWLQLHCLLYGQVGLICLQKCFIKFFMGRTLTQLDFKCDALQTLYVDEEGSERHWLAVAAVSTHFFFASIGYYGKCSQDWTQGDWRKGLASLVGNRLVVTWWKPSTWEWICQQKSCKYKFSP